MQLCSAGYTRATGIYLQVSARGRTLSALVVRRYCSGRERDELYNLRDDRKISKVSKQYLNRNKSTSIQFETLHGSSQWFNNFLHPLTASTPSSQLYALSDPFFGAASRSNHLPRQIIEQEKKKLLRRSRELSL